MITQAYIYGRLGTRPYIYSFLWSVVSPTIGERLIALSIITILLQRESRLKMEIGAPSQIVSGLSIDSSILNKISTRSTILTTLVADSEISTKMIADSALQG